MKVLAIVAHPDDESLFCGGTLAGHVLNGDPVHVVSMGTGVGARWIPESEIVPAVEAREFAFRAACKILGATAELRREYPDQQADVVPQLTLNRAVEGLMERYQPDMIYSHHVGDLNVDHRRVGEAVLVATRMGPVVRCMSPEFPDRCVGPAFAPNVRVALWSGTHEIKVRACLAYNSELKPYPHPRSEQTIRERATEAFMEIR